MKHTFTAAIAIAILAPLLAGAGTADASFKGRNGLIAFDSWTGTSQDIGVFEPNGSGPPTMLSDTPDFSEQTPRWSPLMG